MRENGVTFLIVEVVKECPLLDHDHKGGIPYPVDRMALKWRSWIFLLLQVLSVSFNCSASEQEVTTNQSMVQRSVEGRERHRV